MFPSCQKHIQIYIYELIMNGLPRCFCKISYLSRSSRGAERMSKNSIKFDFVYSLQNHMWGFYKVTLIADIKRAGKHHHIFAFQMVEAEVQENVYLHDCFFFYIKFISSFFFLTRQVSLSLKIHYQGKRDGSTNTTCRAKLSITDLVLSHFYSLNELAHVNSGNIHKNYLKDSLGFGVMRVKVTFETL